MNHVLRSIFFNLNWNLKIGSGNIKPNCIVNLKAHPSKVTNKEESKDHSL